MNEAGEAGVASPRTTPAVGSAWRLFLTASLVLSLDLFTKVLVLRTIPENTYNPPWKAVIDGWLYLVHIGNKGAAFGTFSGYSSVLAVLAIFALAAIYFFRRDLELYRPSMQIIFGLIIGGILGNFIDRVWHGHVIDFIDVRLPFAIPGIGTRFPAFNIADSGITVGVSLYFFYSFLVSPFRKPQPDPASAGKAPEKPEKPTR